MGILLKATSVFPVLVFLLSSSSCAIEYEFTPEEYRRSAQVRLGDKHHHESQPKDRYPGSGALSAYRTPLVIDKNSKDFTKVSNSKEKF